MKNTDWKDIAELIGIAAIVASLLFVGLQMKQSQDIAIAERTMFRAATFVELHDDINENADLWARGNAGEDLDAAESVIFRNLVISYSTFHSSAYTAAQQLRLIGLARSNLATFSSFLHENPGARRAWNSHEESYFQLTQQLFSADSYPDWVVEVRSNLERLDQLQD